MKKKHEAPLPDDRSSVFEHLLDNDMNWYDDKKYNMSEDELTASLLSLESKPED